MIPISQSRKFLRPSAPPLSFLVLFLLVSCAKTGTNGDLNGNPRQSNPSARIPINVSSSNSASPATPNTNQSPKTQDELVRQFYDWYLGEIRDGKKPFNNDEKMKQYVTEDLLREIHKRASDSRFDPVLFLENSESGWHDMKVEVGKPKFYKDKAHYEAYVDVTYRGHGGGRNFVDENVVGLQQTGAAWRIASISTKE